MTNDWLFIDYVNVLFSSNSQQNAEVAVLGFCCLSIMSMFSFQAIHNKHNQTPPQPPVVYRLCQCSLFKQFTTMENSLSPKESCLSIMSMFSFQAIHNPRQEQDEHGAVVYRLCQCSLFKQFTTKERLTTSAAALFIDYVNVLFSSNSQLSDTYVINGTRCLSIMSMFSFQAIHNKARKQNALLLVVYRLCQCSLFKQFTTVEDCFYALKELFIDYVNVLFSSNSQRRTASTASGSGCLSIMSMFSFQAIHND